MATTNPSLPVSSSPGTSRFSDHSIDNSTASEGNNSNTHNDKLISVNSSTNTAPKMLSSSLSNSSLASSLYCDDKTSHSIPEEVPPIPKRIGPKRKGIKKRIRNIFTKRPSSQSLPPQLSQSSLRNHPSTASNPNSIASAPNHTNSFSTGNSRKLILKMKNRSRSKSRTGNSSNMELTKSSICDLRSLGTIDLNHDDDFNDETQSSVVSVIFDDLDAFHTARCSSSASLDIDVLKEDWNILSDAQLRSGENGATKYCGNRRRCISAGNQRIVARGRSNSSNNNPVKCTGTQNNNELSMPSTDTLYERETDSIGSVNPTSQSQSSNLSFTDPDGDECRNSREDSSKTSLHDTTRLFEEGTDPIASCDYDDNHTHTALDTIYQTEDENEIIEKHDIQNDSTDDALFMNHLSSLFHLGKKLYEQGQYEKAYNIQMDALETISPFRSSCEESEIESGKNGKIINQFKNTKINPCAERLDAMIRYELANIEYTMVRENASTVTENGDNDVHDGRDQAIGDSTTAILSQLHSQVEYAKCRIAMVNYQYYKRELTAVENSNDGSDLNQIYNKLYILHNLGKLCDEDLHLYDEALKYYQHALSIETAVLDAFQKSNKSMHTKKDATASDSKLSLGSKSLTPSQMRGELDWDTREFTERVRKTKDKIGSIYYTSGRFDLALLSSFSS